MIIKVKVNTNSKKSEIIKITEDNYLIKFFAVREKGKANEKLIELLANHFAIPKSSIELLNGHTSSNKVIKLHL